MKVKLVCFAAFMSTSCGFLLGGGDQGRPGKIHIKEQGVHCQYAEGPLPKYIVVDAQVECQAYNPNGDPEGGVKNIKVDSCTYYKPSVLGDSVTHYRAKRDDTDTHPCQLSFDTTRVDFEREGDTYRAKRYVDGVLKEDIALSCEAGSEESSYDNMNCGDVNFSFLDIPAVTREPSIVCSFSLDAVRYCFEFFGVTSLEASQLSYIDKCNLSPQPRNNICSDGGYREYLCDFNLDAGKRVIGWNRTSNETVEGFCSRLKSVGEFEKLMP